MTRTELYEAVAREIKKSWEGEELYRNPDYEREVGYNKSHYDMAIQILNYLQNEVGIAILAEILKN